MESNLLWKSILKNIIELHRAASYIMSCLSALSLDESISLASTWGFYLQPLSLYPVYYIITRLQSNCCVEESKVYGNISR